MRKRGRKSLRSHYGRVCGLIGRLAATVVEASGWGDAVTDVKKTGSRVLGLEGRRERGDWMRKQARRAGWENLAGTPAVLLFLIPLPASFFSVLIFPPTVGQRLPPGVPFSIRTPRYGYLVQVWSFNSKELAMFIPSNWLRPRIRPPPLHTPCPPREPESWPLHFTGSASILSDHPGSLDPLCSAGCVSGCYGAVPLYELFLVFTRCSTRWPSSKYDATEHGIGYRLQSIANLVFPPSSIILNNLGPGRRYDHPLCWQENPGQLQHTGWGSKMAQWSMGAYLISHVCAPSVTQPPPPWAEMTRCFLCECAGQKSAWWASLKIIADRAWILVGNTLFKAQKNSHVGFPCFTQAPRIQLPTSPPIRPPATKLPTLCFLGTPSDGAVTAPLVEMMSCKIAILGITAVTDS
ncbi:hypothetical protein CSAL01_09775 [Colletotrichum salicis]|uniref:Uncharacterized protein n=1 Tax=Colletotrichum salicis TaxID=1209931 RepID=A0A135UFT0_9PEZI|nr:hypothetical protein CSAL01_09775 [Colletotrichum salicis]